MSESSEAKTERQSEPDGTQELITIIVPTRNEAGNIGPLLRRLSEAIQDLPAEVLFVDDSLDDTAQRIINLQNQYQFPIRLIARPPENRNGLSGAVVDGFRAAIGGWVCVMDADLQHPPETIPRMWEKAEKSAADLVVGSRRGDVVGPLGLTKTRSLTSKSLTILARMLFPGLLRNVSDPLTGLFLVKRSKIHVDELRPDGFKILLEILVRCPYLHVTEIYFDFAPRYEGQSKADFREGVRFFRHLVRLRVTINPHLIRFLITLCTGLIGNSLLLWALVERTNIAFWLSGLLAVETLILWIAFSFKKWVFPERKGQNSQRAAWKSLLVAQFILVFLYLPIMFGLVSWLKVNYLVANFFALGVVGLLLYGVSEQWVWTSGSMVWQPFTYFYNIHDILTIESQVQLADLQYFAVSALDKDVDIQIRLDRQGLPSRLPGGISYGEQVGRFGFGMTVLPGDLMQIVVSPLLGHSPSFLFTNIVEPAIRWRLVPKGYVLVKAASVCSGSSAVLIHGDRDLGDTVSVLCNEFDYQFMADDLTIVDQDAKVYSYPKPVTISQRMARNSEHAIGIRDRLSRSGQHILYTQFVRRIGIWLSDRNLPAATLNTYLQRLVPQPKDMLNSIFAGVEIGDKSQCSLIINTEQGIDRDREDILSAMSDCLQQGEESSGFQPNPLLAARLRFWTGKDLMVTERSVIMKMVEASKLRWFESKNSDWWYELAREVYENDLSRNPSLFIGKRAPGVAELAKVQGKPKAS